MQCFCLSCSVNRGLNTASRLFVGFGEVGVIYLVNFCVDFVNENCIFVNWLF